MACPVCGKPSPCAHEQKRSAVVGPEAYDESDRRFAPRDPSARPSSPGKEEFLKDQPWRQEIVSRLRQHRARRRRHFDPSATLEFNFQEPPSAAESVEGQAAHRSSIPPVEPPKVIEFPRARLSLPQFSHSQALAESFDNMELAEPVLDAPRILDAPEPPPVQMELLPTFDDIQLEEAETNGNRHGLELPPHPAPLSYRIFAGLIDLTIVLVASAIFATGFVMFGRGLPQPKSVLLCVFMVCGNLWLIYEYLFLVYSVGTPGMQLAGLELCTFRGDPVSLALRRWRALASMLSALAAGLGFIWAFVDEDTLGWHDRITQTYVRRSS